MKKHKKDQIDGLSKKEREEKFDELIGEEVFFTFMQGKVLEIIPDDLDFPAFRIRLKKGGKS